MDVDQLYLLLIPVALLDVGGRLTALWSLYNAERVRFDNKWLWAAIILFVSFFGWLGYFVAGRVEAGDPK